MRTRLALAAAALTVAAVAVTTAGPALASPDVEPGWSRYQLDEEAPQPGSSLCLAPGLATCEHADPLPVGTVVLAPPTDRQDEAGDLVIPMVVEDTGLKVWHYGPAPRNHWVLSTPTEDAGPETSEPVPVWTPGQGAGGQASGAGQGTARRSWVVQSLPAWVFLGLVAVGVGGITAYRRWRDSGDDGPGDDLPMIEED